jgi:chemotaxis protein CheX
MTRVLFATDEQIVGIAQDVWSTFTGTSIRAADDETAAGSDDIIVGSVAVSGEWQGYVLLACPTQLARTAASAMFEVPAGKLTDDEVADALGELTNMVGGNVKSLLPGPARLSLPTVTVGESFVLRMPRAELLNKVSLACDGLELTVSVWQT